MFDKSSKLDTIKKILKGDYDMTHNEFIKKDGTIIDSHPLQGKLVAFRITGQDQSKNTIQNNGSSVYLLIDKVTAKLVSDKDGKHTKNPILQGYDEITGNMFILIDCGTNTPQQESE